MIEFRLDGAETEPEEELENRSKIINSKAANDNLILSPLD